MPLAASIVGMGPPPEAFEATHRVSSAYGFGAIGEVVMRVGLFTPPLVRLDALMVTRIYNLKILKLPLSQLTIMSPPLGVTGRPVAVSMAAMSGEVVSTPVHL